MRRKKPDREPPVLPVGMRWHLRELNYDAGRFMWEIYAGASDRDRLASEDYYTEKPFSLWHALWIWPAVRRAAKRTIRGRQRAEDAREMGKRYR